MASHDPKEAAMNTTRTTTTTTTTTDPVESPEEARARAKARIERLAAAKAESKELKAWAAAGSKGPRPSTPNLDSLNELAAKGTTGRRRSPKAAEVEAPAPTAKRGEVVVTLRSAAHAAMIAGVTPSDAVTVTGRHITFRNADAQPVFDSIVAGLADPGGEFPRRLLNLAAALVRQACPKVVDSRSGVASKVLTALAGQSKPWTVAGRGDAQLVFTLGSGEPLTAGAMARKLGVVEAKAEKPLTPERRADLNGAAAAKAKRSQPARKPAAKPAAKRPARKSTKATTAA